MNTVWCSERRQTATCVTFWGLFVDFYLMRHRKMSGNINVTDHNTLPVLDNIRNMKPCSGSKMRTIQGLKELWQRLNSRLALIARFGHLSHKSQSCSFISHLLVRGHGRAAMTTKDPCLLGLNYLSNSCKRMFSAYAAWLFSIYTNWLKMSKIVGRTLLINYPFECLCYNYIYGKCRNQRNAQWFFKNKYFKLKSAPQTQTTC